MRTELFGIATLALEDAPSSSEVRFGYREGDLSCSARVTNLYERIETHSGRACAIYGLVDLAYRESCAADFIEDFVVARDDPVLSEF